MLESPPPIGHACCVHSALAVGTATRRLPPPLPRARRGPGEASTPRGLCCHHVVGLLRGGCPWQAPRGLRRRAHRRGRSLRRRERGPGARGRPRAGRVLRIQPDRDRGRRLCPAITVSPGRAPTRLPAGVGQHPGPRVKRPAWLALLLSQHVPRPSGLRLCNAVHEAKQRGWDGGVSQ